MKLKMQPNWLLYAALLFGLVLPALCRRSRVEVIEESEEEVSDFSCPEQFGYYPDQGNCSRYHLCDHGKASVKTCDDGLVFSTILKTCDWPYNVHCNVADGNRGEFTGRHLRLRPSEEGKNENSVDLLPTNRRQPVLSAEDDSYWLGRPESSLLLLGDDEEFLSNYNYEEPKRIPKSNRAPQPIPQRQPESRRKEPKEEANNSNNSEDDVDGEGGPWFHSLNFDQIRRQEDRKPSVFKRIENSTTPVSTSGPPATTASVSANGRGGWRQNQRQSSRTTELPQLLPRKALRIGHADEDVLAEDFEGPIREDVERESNPNQLRRKKPSQDSYRLVSHNPTTSHALSTTLPPEVLRPRHLGSSRRRGNRRQTTPAPTTFPPATTVRETTQTSPTQRPWNSRTQPARQSVRQPARLVENQRIPESAFRQFERRPVLRDSEDAPPRENFEDNDDDAILDDAHFFANPVEIRKKGHGKALDDDDLPVNRAKEVANSLDTRRQPKPTSRTTQAPPKSPNKVDPESILRAFQAGFRGAVKPTAAGGSRGATDDDGNNFRGNPSVDMEYEDVGNEDEDENVEEAEADNTDGVAHEEMIKVRYDDDLPITTLPPPTTPPRPTPPRLTQFVDIFVHNKKQQVAGFTPSVRHSTNNAAIQLVDLVSKQQKVVNPVPRSLVHFGLVPGLSPNNSLIFYPPPFSAPGATPKTPRHTSPLDTTDRVPRKSQKVKVKDLKKQSKPKSDSSKGKKYRPQTPLPQSYRQGTYSRAKRCLPEACQPPNCRCGGTDIPGGFSSKEIPQIVLLTFDDSVNDLNREIYKKLFEEGRTNPNGCPVRSTFYVSHEWTDYSQVQNLYSRGHEMASHSISHSFGEKFSKDRWLAEIAGQREIMHLYGGVDWTDIRGMRAPFLQTGGNTMFEMLKEANFSYDSSMPVYDIDPPYWPYTLDYAANHDCMIEPCPTHSIPGLWEVGMVMWEDLRGGRCSMADGCFNPSDEQGVYEMVKANFNRHYNSNRSPFGMYFHSRWFLTEHNMKGFLKFFDEMLTKDDVYVVTNHQMIQWMRRPTPLSQLRNFAPFGCDDILERPPLCKAPHTCKVRFRSEIRTMRTCQSCPRQYPWTGNNGIGVEASR